MLTKLLMNALITLINALIIMHNLTINVSKRCVINMHGHDNTT